MANNIPFLGTQAMLRELGAHFRTQMPELKDVLLDWPNANRKMELPTLTITSGDPTFTPASTPYGINIPSKDADLMGNPVLLTKWVMGEYSWNLQLDFWARDKIQRHQLFQSAFIAMNKPFLDGTVQSIGLTLNLIDYHDTLCHYVFNDHSFEDGEQSSQRREWRMTINMVADAKSILERDQFAILTTEVTVETPDII